MGGATHSILTLIEDMKRKDCEIIVVSPNMVSPFKDILEAQNIRWYVVRYGFWAYPPNSKNILSWLFSLVKMLLVNNVAVVKISKIIKKERVDIVHTNVGPIVCGYKACKKVGIPHIWHIREYGDKDFDIKMFPSKKTFRKWLNNSYVISISKDLNLYNHLNESRHAYIIYNGVRKSEDVRLELPKDKYFLCASRVSPEKGFDQVIRVFAKFHEGHSDFRLIVIGFGSQDYIKKLKEMSMKLNISHVVDFDGYVDNVSDYMSKAKALLVASMNEGFGRMTAEAAFAGTLVIGKDTAGTKEIMDITGGFRYITDDEMLASMNIVTNLTDDQYYNRIVEAQSKAVQYFSKENYVENVYKIYQSILTRKTDQSSKK